MDNYKSLLMETISKEDLVSKPAKIKRVGKLKEDLLPDEVYDTLVRKSKKTYVVGVYSTLPGPGWHYEINTEYGVYTKVPDDEGFIAHWFIQGKPQPSVEEMEDMAHYLIDEYDCREVSLDEYKRIVNGKDESLTEDTVKTSDGKWTNKGKEGTHGKFRTKKEADAQRKAMFANGYRENLKESKEADIDDAITQTKKFLSDTYYRVPSIEHYGKKDNFSFTLPKDSHVFSTSALKKHLKKNGIDVKIKRFSHPQLTHGDIEFTVYLDSEKNESLKALTEATKLEVILSNKKAYEKVNNYIKTLPNGFEKDIYKYIVLEWLKGHNWLGGISDSVFTKQYEKYFSDYDFDVVLDKFHDIIDKKFDNNDNFSESLKEDFDTLYGITCRTTARGMQSLLTLDDKTVAFTSKEEASRCSRALDDSAGHVNRFVYYGVTQISGRNSKNLLVFDSYEEYKEYSDNFIENTRNQEEIARNKLLTVANGIIDELKEELIDAGLNIVNDKHKTYKDVDIDVFAYPSRAEIRIGAGISINGWSYGTITLSVNEDGIVRCDDSSCYVFDEPFEECSQYIVKKVKKLCERSMPKNESLKERYADDAVVLTAPLRKKLNKICQKYSGFHLPQEIAPMWDEFYNLGVEVLIQGYPTDTAPGAKSWTVPFTLNGETVDNSRFVYSVYEGSTGLKNDYNMYFS